MGVSTDVGTKEEWMVERFNRTLLNMLSITVERMSCFPVDTVRDDHMSILKSPLQHTHQLVL